MTTLAFEEEEARVKNGRWFVQAMLAISGACSALLLAWVLWQMRYGFDFADEGFYLAWISNPFKYSVSTTQFGYVYHPLYLLVGGDIVALRRANLLATFVLAWMLVDSVLISIFGRQSMNQASRLAISASVATASFVFLRLWLPTPSYNWLNFQALLVCAIGVVWAERTWTRASLVGWVLIGVGGWLLFMAKPTSAAAFGVCAIIYFLGAKKFSFRLVAIPVAVSGALLLIAAFVIDGSLLLFVQRLRDGIAAAEGLGSGHGFASLFRLDRFILGGKSPLLLLLGTVIIFAAACLSQGRARTSVLAAAVLWAGLVLPAFAIILGSVRTLPYAGDYQHLLLWIVPFASILTGSSMYWFNGLGEISRAHWALLLIFLTFPHIFAFGTANNYWWLGGLVGIFWVVSGLLFLSGRRKIQPKTLLLPFAAGTQLIAAAMVLLGTESPYYQPQPLRQNDFKVSIGSPRSDLLLAQSLGGYVTRAINVSRHAGFQTGTPMIDLSGHSPGVLYAIGAINAGQPWIIGSYPGYTGSDKVAATVLGRVPCEELARAWVLAEPGGPVKLSEEVVSSFGANLNADYELVGTFETVPVVGGFQQIQQQQYLRPKRTPKEALAMCIRARSKQ